MFTTAEYQGNLTQFCVIICEYTFCSMRLKSREVRRLKKVDMKAHSELFCIVSCICQSIRNNRVYPDDIRSGPACMSKSCFKSHSLFMRKTFVQVPAQQRREDRPALHTLLSNAVMAKSLNCHRERALLIRRQH